MCIEKCDRQTDVELAQVAIDKKEEAQMKDPPLTIEEIEVEKALCPNCTLQNCKLPMPLCRRCNQGLCATCNYIPGIKDYPADWFYCGQPCYENDSAEAHAPKETSES